MKTLKCITDNILRNIIRKKDIRKIMYQMHQQN